MFPFITVLGPLLQIWIPMVRAGMVVLFRLLVKFKHRKWDLFPDTSLISKSFWLTFSAAPTAHNYPLVPQASKIRDFCFNFSCIGLVDWWVCSGISFTSTKITNRVWVYFKGLYICSFCLFWVAYQSFRELFLNILSWIYNCYLWRHMHSLPKQ